MGANFNDISNLIQLNIGHFERGRWDYINLLQLYPKYEFIAQLVPRKTPAENKEATVLYQRRTETTGRPAKIADTIQPVNQATSVRKKISLVKWVDSRGWTEDMDALLGKPIDHIEKSIQLELLDLDYHYWEDKEHNLLRMPANLNDDDDNVPFGIPAWVTGNPGVTGFDMHGGLDPYPAGRPGGISVAQEPFFTNAVGKFATVSDGDLFDKLETFSKRRKLSGVVPNPRLIPDTPSDVIYTNIPIHNAIQRYLTASNEMIGMDVGRYRGEPTFKGTPITVWHAADSPDSPVRDDVGTLRWLDWNSFEYSVQPGYDRRMSPVKDMPYVPSGVYVTLEDWSNICCHRPDRNLLMTSDSPSLQS